jgi:hypothetical protein
MQRVLKEEFERWAASLGACAGLAESQLVGPTGAKDGPNGLVFGPERPSFFRHKVVDSLICGCGSVRLCVDSLIQSKGELW